MPTPYQNRRYVGDVNIGAAGDPIGYARFAAAQPAGSKYQICDGKPATVAINSANAPFVTSPEFGDFNVGNRYTDLTQGTAIPGMLPGCYYYNVVNERHYAIASSGGASYSLWTKLGVDGTWEATTGTPTTYANNQTIEFVAYAFGKFWTIDGASGNLQSSTDGIAFTNVSPTVTSTGASLIICDGYLWLLGTAPKYANDGTTWTAPTNIPTTGVVGTQSRKIIKAGGLFYVSGTGAGGVYTTNPYTGAWTSMGTVAGGTAVNDNMCAFGDGSVVCFADPSNGNAYFFTASTAASLGTRSMIQMTGGNWSNWKMIASTIGILIYSFIDGSQDWKWLHITTWNQAAVTPTVVLPGYGGSSDSQKLCYDASTQMLFWPGRSNFTKYTYNYVGKCVPIVPTTVGLNAYIKLG